jgi:hypothetical protein
MAEEFVIEKYVVKMLLRGLIGLLLLAALAYPVDFAIWRTRLALSKDGRGGMGSVEVNRVVAAELKGGKEDYYFDGKMMVDCSKSLFPQGGVGVCWWVEGHRDVVVRY